MNAPFDDAQDAVTFRTVAIFHLWVRSGASTLMKVDVPIHCNNSVGSLRVCIALLFLFRGRFDTGYTRG